MTTFVPTPDWIDAIVACPEAECTSAAYPYARVAAGGFRVVCRKEHTNIVPSLPLEATSP